MRLLFSKRPSLRQIRWLPVMFFCAMMLFGLRLHETQRSLFDNTPMNFLSKFSFLKIASLEAANAPATPTHEAPSPAAPSQPPTSSFPESKVNSSVPPPPPATATNPSVNATQTPQKEPDSSPKTFDILNLTTEEVKVLQSLATRRLEIERREKEVSDKEKLIQVIEKRIQDKVTELQGIQETLKELLVAREKQESEELKGLIKIYELMKPEKAAEILSGLGAEVLLVLLNGMKDNKLAPILANMNPAIAQQITMGLADRRKLTQEIQQLSQQQPLQP